MRAPHGGRAFEWLLWGRSTRSSSFRDALVKSVGWKHRVLLADDVRVGGAYGPSFGPFRGRGRGPGLRQRGKICHIPLFPPSSRPEGNFCLSSRPRAVARSPSPDLRRHARPRTHCRLHAAPLGVTCYRIYSRNQHIQSAFNNNYRTVKHILNTRQQTIRHNWCIKLLYRVNNNYRIVEDILNTKQQTIRHKWCIKLLHRVKHNNITG